MDYEKPKLIRLHSKGLVGQGACTTGSAPDEGCASGSSAGYYCKPTGSDAGGLCETGSSPGTTGVCSTGSVPDGGCDYGTNWE